MRQQDSEPTWLWKFHLTQPMAEAGKKTPGRCGVSSAKITSFQLVFGWYISIYIDKFWRCFSFGPQKSEEDFPMLKKIFFFAANWGDLRCWTSLLVSLNRWGVGSYARDGRPSFSEHLRKWGFLGTFNSNMYKTTNHLIMIHIFV